MLHIQLGIIKSLNEIHLRLSMIVCNLKCVRQFKLLINDISHTDLYVRLDVTLMRIRNEMIQRITDNSLSIYSYENMGSH